MRNSFGAVACAIAFIAAPLSAAPVTWTFSGATFNDGATLSGSFVYDADVDLGPFHGEILSGSIVTTNGSLSNGQTYNLASGVFSDPNSGSATWNLYSTLYFSGNIDESIGIFFTAKPTGAGGTIPMSFAFERRDDNTNGQQNLYFVSASGANAGAITASAAAASPEPVSIALCGAGLLAIGVSRSRKTKP